MCLGKWFHKVDPVNPEWSNKTISILICGNYPGTVNDLAGPPHDLEDFQKKMNTSFSDYDIRKFKDSETTGSRLLTEIRLAVDLTSPGDLLTFIMDNCYSESNTKNINSPEILGQRVHIPKNLPRRKIVRSRAFSQASNYLAMSACLDHETAADAEFEHPNGAYTYCLLKTLVPGITYLQWHERTKKMLHDLGFDQTCTIEGPLELQNRKVFEGNNRTIYLSSHGSHTYDKSGDEQDGQDEGPFLFDRLVIDDEINLIITTNPYLC